MRKKLLWQRETGERNNRKGLRESKERHKRENEKKSYCSRGEEVEEGVYERA